MKNALALELADLWELQAAADHLVTHAQRRATLRECAHALRMLVDLTETTPPPPMLAPAAPHGFSCFCSTCCSTCLSVAANPAP